LLGRRSFCTAGTNELLESGSVYFLYQPKVGLSAVSRYDDVQRFYVLLQPQKATVQSQQPQSSKDSSLNRVLVFSRKTLPDSNKSSKCWAFIDKASANIQDLVPIFGERVKITKTRGDRKTDACRILAKGSYAICMHDDHTHWLYNLDSPPGEAQAAFNIKPNSQYIVTVRNPASENPPDSGLQRSAMRAAYPEGLQQLFGDRKYSILSPVDFLNYAGCELVLLGVSEATSCNIKQAQDELASLKTSTLSNKGVAELLQLNGALSTQPIETGKWA